MSEQSQAAPAAESQVESSEVESDVVEGAEVEASSEESDQGELEQNIQDAIDAGASEKEIKQMIKEFELKVNGKTVKRKIDLSDENAVKAELQKAYAGQEAMQRARELEKVFEQEIRRLKQNPWEVLKELELDPDELNEQYMQSRIEELKKSPEQIERERLQSELENARKELDRQRKEAEEAKYTALQQQEAKKLNDEIEQALSAHKGRLPKSGKVITKIADAMLWAMENGYEDVSVADVLPAVENELRSEISSFLEDMPDEFLEEYIGKKNSERLRKRRLAAAKQAQSVPKQNIQPTAKSSESLESSKSDRAKLKDFFRSLK